MAKVKSKRKRVKIGDLRKVIAEANSKPRYIRKEAIVDALEKERFKIDAQKYYQHLSEWINL